MLGIGKAIHHGRGRMTVGPTTGYSGRLHARPVQGSIESIMAQGGLAVQPVPLRRPLADPYLIRDFGPGASLSTQRGNLRDIHSHPRPSKPSALGARVPKAGANAFLNEGSLELRHRTDDLKHQATGWGAQVDVVPQADEGYPERCEFGQCVNQVLQRPRNCCYVAV